MYYLNKIFILLILIKCNTIVAQQNNNIDNESNIEKQDKYLHQRIDKKEFDKHKWETLREKTKIDESFQKRNQEAAQNNKPAQNKAISGTLENIIKWTVYIIIFGILMYLIFRAINFSIFNKNKKLKTKFSIEEIENDLNNAEIDPHLYAAIKSKNYKLAIRLYYLKIIQKLHEKEKIIWRKHKTNKHYLQEMYGKEDYGIFKEITLQYEKYWFGNTTIDETKYNTLSMEFVNYHQNIK